jgi:hypothetical protein
MLKDRKIIAITKRAVAVLFGAMILAIVLPCGAFAAPPAVATPNVHESATALAQEWLKEQGVAKSAPAPPAQQADDSVDYLSSGIGAIHDQIIALAGAIPQLPHEFKRAAASITMIDADFEQPEFLLDLGIFGDPYYLATRRLAAETRALLDLALFGACAFGASMVVPEDDGAASRPPRRAPYGDRKGSSVGHRSAFRSCFWRDCSLRSQQSRSASHPRYGSGPSRDAVELCDRLRRDLARGRHRRFAVGSQ